MERATKSNFLGIKSRLDRIVMLIYGNPLKISEISEIIESNPRTTYRDVIKLIRLGYPIERKNQQYLIPKPNKPNQ